MKCWDAVEKLNQRRAAALDDPNQEAMVVLAPTDSRARAEMAGLGVDAEDLNDVVSVMVSSAVNAAGIDTDGIDERMAMVLKTLARDSWVAGVIYGRDSRDEEMAR